MIPLHQMRFCVDGDCIMHPGSSGLRTASAILPKFDLVIFFERTTQDSVSFYLYSRKIQDYSLRDHRQEKEKKRKKRARPVGLGHQHRELRNSTPPVGLGINTGSNPPQLSPSWTGASTQVKTQRLQATAAEQVKMPRLPTFSYPRSRCRNTIPRR